MEPYVHKVQYYETDKMGIVHHSNYIRWMEEARIDFLEKIGWAFDRLEAEGLFSPVIGVDCFYKSPTKFGDSVEIHASVAEYTGVKLIIQYEMRKGDLLVAKGHTEHTFVSDEGKILRMKKAFPELHELLLRLAEEHKQ
ncbi:MAG: acyl-CoA thioesterase [Firmicutes bacterium]|nr:acyl-CoA thioesterase [Bacillota bacterium]